MNHARSARIIVFLFTSMFLAKTVTAKTITFDDIQISAFSGDGYLAINNGYQGLTWNNLFAIDAKSFLFNSGYAAGLVTPHNDVFNGSGQSASFSSNTPFTFDSAYLTAVWNNGLNITVQGFDGTTMLDSANVVVSSTIPALETFHWSGLTEVAFTSFGGVPNPNYSGRGTQFVLDNLSITETPEPPASVLLGLGVSGMLLLSGKRFLV